MTATAVAPAQPLSLRSRLIGFGSVYGKSIRDSRRAFLIAAIFLGVFQFVILAGVSSIYATPEARREIINLVKQLGAAASGMAGNPVNIGTLGGYVSWKYGSIFVVFAGMWSILALSGTLVGEARRGSLDLLASTPLSKQRIAVEKVGAHLTLLAIIVAIQTLAAWAGGAVYAKTPADEISLAAAFGFALWIGLMAIAFGSVALAVSQFWGRAAGVGIAGALLVMGWIIQGYHASIPGLGALTVLTPWAWTYDHVPLAGQYVWISLLPLALVPVVLLPLGIAIFNRRDIGAVTTTGLRLPWRAPRVAVGLAGPTSRSFAERLPLALAWGLGLGAFMLVMASISPSLSETVAKSPELIKVFKSIFPGFEPDAGGFLQLMLQILFIVAGLAGATMVSGWASDETTGRLEMVLATPLARAGWAVRAGLGMFGGVAVMTLIAAAGVAIGAASSNSDVLTPLVGTVALGLFALAATGVGLAIGGVFRTSVAAETVALVVVATYLLDVLGEALSWPDWTRQLSLTAHMGRPMIGEWDAVGVVACLALALGGLLLGAWGIARRDLRS
ncbi:MAG TPA: ABC transporter permease subunit [Candidatus Limnocylindria bacterium]